MIPWKQKAIDILASGIPLTPLEKCRLLIMVKYSPDPDLETQLTIIEKSLDSGLSWKESHT